MDTRPPKRKQKRQKKQTAIEKWQSELQKTTFILQKKCILLEDIDDILPFYAGNESSLDLNDEDDYDKALTKVPLHALRSLKKIFVSKEASEEIERISQKVSLIGAFTTETQEILIANNEETSKEFASIISEELGGIRRKMNCKGKGEIVHAFDSLLALTLVCGKLLFSFSFSFLFNLMRCTKKGQDFQNWFILSKEKEKIKEILNTFKQFWEALVVYSNRELDLSNGMRDRAGVFKILEKWQVSLRSNGYQIEMVPKKGTPSPSPSKEGKEKDF